LYFEKTCFVGQSLESSGNTQKQKRKRKAENTFFRNAQRREIEKPTFMKHLGRDTIEGAAQAQPATH
jgi:hypothetical protein